MALRPSGPAAAGTFAAITEPWRLPLLGIVAAIFAGAVLVVGGQNGCYESGGFDLPGLICGHEGTFGIITSLFTSVVGSRALVHAIWGSRRKLDHLSI